MDAGGAPPQGAVAPTHRGSAPASLPDIYSPHTAEAPALIPRSVKGAATATEIALESRRVLRRRILRHSAQPAIITAVVWLLLVVGYVHSTAPGYLLIMPLGLLSGEMTLDQLLIAVGLRTGPLITALIAGPIIGAALGIAGAVLSAGWVARIDPRRIAKSDDVVRVAGRRLAVGYLAAAVLAVPAVLILMALGVHMPWKEVTWGTLSGLGGAAAILTITGLWILPGRTGAARILRPQPFEAGGRVPGIEAGTPAIIDPRPSLPVRPGRFGLMELRVLGVTGMRALALAVPMLGLVCWAVLGMGDLVTLFTRLSDSGPSSMAATAGLTLTQLFAAIVIGLICVGATAAAPRAIIAMKPAPEVRPLHGGTVLAGASERERWHSSVATMLGAILLLIWGAGTVLWWVVVAAITEAPAIIAVLGSIMLFVGAPLMYAVGYSAGRRGLWAMVDGPIGDYALRRSPWALIAPETGSRAQRPGAREASAVAGAPSAVAGGGAGVGSASAPVPGGATAVGPNGARGSGGDGQGSLADLLVGGPVSVPAGAAVPLGAREDPGTLVHEDHGIAVPHRPEFRRQRSLDLPDFDLRARRRHDPSAMADESSGVPTDISDLPAG